MANGGYKKQQFTSRALRPGGFGTVPPPKPGGSSGSKLLGVSTAGLPKPKGGGNVGAKITGPTAAKAPTAPKAPSFKVGPKLPSMPKIKI